MSVARLIIKYQFLPCDEWKCDILHSYICEIVKQSEMFMTFATSDKTNEALQAFNEFDVDTKLALLWFGYLDIKDELNPVNTTSSQKLAEAVFNQIQSMSKEEQLQAQRDIASNADTTISREYYGLDPSARLDLWLRLSQGMEKGTIISMPEGYKLPENTNDFVKMVSSLDFEQRIEFTRSAVMKMGATARPGSPV
jgi:Orange carotenoid protein, N-terminal